MLKVTVVHPTTEDFDKFLIARQLVGLISALGLRDIVLKMLRGY